MPTPEELTERIRQLETENSELRDKLDMIYAILAPEDSAESEEEIQNVQDSDELIQLTGGN